MNDQDSLSDILSANANGWGTYDAYDLVLDGDKAPGKRHKLERNAESLAQAPDDTVTPVDWQSEHESGEPIRIQLQSSVGPGQ